MASDVCGPEPTTCVSWTWDCFLFSCSSSCFFFFSSFSFFFAVFSFFLISNLCKQMSWMPWMKLQRLLLLRWSQSKCLSPSLQHLSLFNSVEQLLLSFLLRHLLQTGSVLGVSHQIIIVAIPEHVILRGVGVWAGGRTVALGIRHFTWKRGINTLRISIEILQKLGPMQCYYNNCSIKYY